MDCSDTGEQPLLRACWNKARVWQAWHAGQQERQLASISSHQRLAAPGFVGTSRGLPQALKRGTSCRSGVGGGTCRRDRHVPPHGIPGEEEDATLGIHQHPSRLADDLLLLLLLCRRRRSPVLRPLLLLWLLLPLRLLPPRLLLRLRVLLLLLLRSAAGATVAEAGAAALLRLQGGCTVAEALWISSARLATPASTPKAARASAAGSKAANRRCSARRAPPPLLWRRTSSQRRPACSSSFVPQYKASMTKVDVTSFSLKKRFTTPCRQGGKPYMRQAAYHSSRNTAGSTTVAFTGWGLDSGAAREPGQEKLPACVKNWQGQPPGDVQQAGFAWNPKKASFCRYRCEVHWLAARRRALAMRQAGAPPHNR